VSPSGTNLSGTPTATGAFTFDLTATDAIGCTSAANSYMLTVAPHAAADSYMGGLGNTQLVVGGGTPGGPAITIAGKVVDNDDAPMGATVGPASIATTGGGTVALDPSGTFVYSPPVGFTGPTDTFMYTLTSNGVTSSATVSIAVANRVWFVDSSYAGGNGASDGRSHRPFTTLSAADAPSAANDRIFVATGSGATTGSLTLKSGQVLWGQGTAFSYSGLMIAAGTKPTLSGAITLASNTTVSSLNIAPPSTVTGLAGTAVSSVTVQNAVNVTGTNARAINVSGCTTCALDFGSVSASGGVNGISLSNATGSFSVTGGTIQNTTGVGVLLATVKNVTLSGLQVTNSGSEGIQLTDGTGAVAFSGVTVTGSAHNNVVISSSTGTIDSLTVSGTYSSTNATTGANGLMVSMTGTSALTAATLAGDYENNAGSGVYAEAGGMATIGSFTVNANKFGGNGNGMNFFQAGSANLTFKVDGGTATSALSHAINVASSSASTGGTITGRIQNTTLSGSTFGDGIRVAVQGQTRGILLIDNNTVSGANVGRGIDVRGLSQTAGMLGTDVTITNNKANLGSVSQPAGIYAGSDNTGTSGILRADVRLNTVTNTGTSTDTNYLRMEALGGATTRLVGMGTTPAMVLSATNTGNAGTDGNVTLIAGPISTPP
jgi:hypothetical protein